MTVFAVAIASCAVLFGPVMLLVVVTCWPLDRGRS